MKKHEKILKALANSRRLEIISFLKKNREATVGEIASHLKLSFRSTSKHLSVLAGVEIVGKEQRSVSGYYHLLSPSPLVRTVLSII